MSTSLTTIDIDLLKRQRCGVIEMQAGQLRQIQFRWWPKYVSLADVMWWGARFHRRSLGDRCWVYYHQPRRFPNFLALTYLLSTRDCSLATVFGGLDVLDEIACIKRSDAVLCDAWNRRISERVLKRKGWEPHAKSRWHRNYIKRFYGNYPQIKAEVGRQKAEGRSGLSSTC
jgi:hypothetical protein